MKIGVPKEIHAGERRVATTPDVAVQLIKLGFDVAVETGAGVAANYSDDAYKEAGCDIVSATDDLWWQSDLILKVSAPEGDEAGKLSSGQMLVSFLWPAQNSELLQQLTDSGVTAMAMDSVPRISRAQKMDALSSMANIAGYRAIVEAAQHFPRFFTGQITAAGADGIVVAAKGGAIQIKRVRPEGDKKIAAADFAAAAGVEAGAVLG